jgi:hypothetical protein
MMTLRAAIRKSASSALTKRGAMRRKIAVWTVGIALGLAVSAAAAADDSARCKLTRPDGTTSSIPCPSDESGKTHIKNAGGSTRSDNYAQFIAEAEKTLADELKDPDSAKWKNVYVVGTRIEWTGICGDVLAKNSYGAYTGWKRFVGKIQPHAAIVIDDSDQGSKMIIAAAYSGLNAAWGGDGRTIFGTFNAAYEALIPFDGYCLARVDPTTPAPTDPCDARGQDASAGPMTKNECFTARYSVTIGMTPDQIERLGRLPKRIEEKPLDIAGRKTVQWRYETFSLYFENGVLYAIQHY